MANNPSSWDRLDRVISLPLATPYRTKNLNKSEEIYLDENGHLMFGPNDIENPKNWSFLRKGYITLVAIFLVLNATFASSSPTGTTEGINRHFGVSDEAGQLVTTLFLLGYCAGPLLWGPLSEFYGRRYIFYSTFLTYFAFNFLCAFANNFAALLIGRFLTGTFASAALSNSPGVLADLWEHIERGIFMAFFSMMTFIGPALGPVISGFLQITEDWRWSFYVLIWLSFASLVLLFTIPETLPQQVLYNKAKRIRQAGIPGYENVKAPVEDSDRTLAGIFKKALVRPWILLFDPIAFWVALYMSIVYALVYMLFTIYPIVFQEMRGWNAGVGELPLLGLIVGANIGGLIVIYEATLARKKQMAGVVLGPEDRMPLAMIGGVIFPIAMFWFAWTGNFNSIHWAVPTVAGAVLNVGVVLIFVSYLNYLTDAYLMNVASVMAGNTIVRSACGAASPLFVRQMFSALGVGGAGSLIGGIAVLLAPIPFLFWRYGGAIRKRSKWAPTEFPKASKANSSQVSRDEAVTADGALSPLSEEELRREASEPSSADLEKDTAAAQQADNDAADRFDKADDIEKAE